MELIQEINPEDIGEKSKKVKYDVRKASRAVLFDGDKIALLFVSQKGFHKIPGGGVEKDEDVQKALLREIREEAGCVAKIQNEIGTIIEYRDEIEQINISYGFIAKVISKNELLLTEQEKKDGFTLEWVKLDDAIRQMEKDRPLHYVEKFMAKRDLTFLKKAKEITEKKP